MIRDSYFLGMADLIKTKSLDPNTQIGAVLVGGDDMVITTGYNKFPFGVANTDERWKRPVKYQYVVHAEHNAILTAARLGLGNLLGSRLYLVGMGPPTLPCLSCAKAIIQAGIREVIGSGYKPATEGWDNTLKNSLDLLLEAGVRVREVPYNLVQEERSLDV